MEGTEDTKKASLDSELAKKIKKQVEFYFSDSNFPRDKFLRGESAKHPEGYVSIATLAAFKRMKMLSEDVEFITKVLRTSEKLKVDETGKMVKRVDPLPTEDTTLPKSIAVKGLPQTEAITIEALSEFFASIGNVMSVRLIRNKDNDRTFSGSAFVEFDTEEAVKTALETPLKFEDNELTIETKNEYLKKTKERKYNFKKRRREEAQEADEGQDAKEEEGNTNNNRRTSQWPSGIFICVENVPDDVNRFDVKVPFEEEGNVCFVDFPTDTPGKGYIRMSSPEEAAKAVAAINGIKKVSSAVISCRQLAGSEEEEYVAKVIKQKKTRGPSKPKHQRRNSKWNRGH